MRNKNKIKSSFLPLIPSSHIQLLSQLIYILPTEQHRGKGSESYSQFITLQLYCSFLLTLSPSSSTGFLPQETVLHEQLQCEYFPQAAVLQELLQYGSFYAVQSIKNRLFRRGSPRGSTDSENLLLVVFSMSHSSFQEPVLVRGLHRPELPSSLPRAGEESMLWCLKHLFFLLHCPVCLKSCFCHIFSFLSHSCCEAFFYPFLNMLSQGITVIADGLSFEAS